MTLMCSYENVHWKILTQKCEEFLHHFSLYLHHQCFVFFLFLIQRRNLKQTWKNKDEPYKSTGDKLEDTKTKATKTEEQVRHRWKCEDGDRRTQATGGNTELQMQASPAGLQSRGSDPRVSVSLIVIFGFSDEIHCRRNHEHTEKKHCWTWCWQTDIISHTINLKEQ